MELHKFHVNAERIFAFTVGQRWKLRFFESRLFAAVRMKDEHIEIGQATSDAQSTGWRFLRIGRRSLIIFLPPWTEHDIKTR